MMRTKRRNVVLIASLALAGLMCVRPASAQNRTARGTTTAVTDVSLSVKVGERDMTFAIDSKTVVEAPGAGRQTRAAQAAGAVGIKLTSVIQSGQPVLVTYTEANGRNLATNISRVSSAGSGGGSMTESPAAATGIVKSVTASTLVVTTNGKDSTFTLDQKTLVVGRGAGSATAAAGGRIAITNLVSAGDTVQVSYSPAEGSMRATEVRVTAKVR